MKAGALHSTVTTFRDEQKNTPPPSIKTHQFASIKQQCLSLWVIMAGLAALESKMIWPDPQITWICLQPRIYVYLCLKGEHCGICPKKHSNVPEHICGQIKHEFISVGIRISIRDLW